MHGCQPSRTRSKKPSNKPWLQLRKCTRLQQLLQVCTLLSLCACHSLRLFSSLRHVYVGFVDIACVWYIFIIVRLVLQCVSSSQPDSLLFPLDRGSSHRSPHSQACSFILLACSRWDRSVIADLVFLFPCFPPFSFTPFPLCPCITVYDSIPIFLCPCISYPVHASFFFALYVCLFIEC